jgi:hypothetical protein
VFRLKWGVELNKDDDSFEYWLMDMDDAIHRFIGGYPVGDRQRFDYSSASLDFLERWLLNQYQSIEAMRQQDQAAMVDGAARYVGQVFRRHLGGKWFIDNEDKKNVFYKRPQLVGVKGQLAQFSPLSMVTASVDRNSGSYMSGVLSKLKANAGV